MELPLTYGDLEGPWTNLSIEPRGFLREVGEKSHLEEKLGAGGRAALEGKIRGLVVTEDSPTYGVGHDNAEGRIADMDREGVDVHLLIPGTWPQSVTVCPTDVATPRAPTGLYESYARYMADFCSIDTGRLKSLLQLTGEDVEWSVRHIEQCGDGPSVAGAMLALAEGYPIDDPDLEPIWAALAAADLPLLHHSFFYEPPYFPGYRDVWDNIVVARTAAHPWGAHDRCGWPTFCCRACSTGTPDAITAVADETGGFTGADLMHLARSAGLEAANRLAKGREGFELADSLEGTELAVELADFEAALRTVRPSVLRDVVTRAERITWDQIVGLGELKARLRELGRRAVESDAAASDAEDRAAGSGQGVLLYGPPGSGKSALVHALASELGVNFVAIEGSKVYNQWLGESEETVRALFRRAGEARPSLVMLDHLDALAPVRAGESGERTDERVVSALLASLDDVLAAGSVFVVGASNRPELIDPAVLRSGRVGVHLEVANPDRGRRVALIAALAGVHRLELDEDLTAELAESTDGWSAADIMMLAGEAASRSAMEDRPMSFDDLVDALPAITRL